MPPSKPDTIKKNLKGFNLRRDHRSLATNCRPSICKMMGWFQSQARPPLPCHVLKAIPCKELVARFNLRRDHRSLATHPRQDRASYLDGFNLRRDHRSLATKIISLCVRRIIQVSISGETTAPLPPCKGYPSVEPLGWFQSQARPPLPCHMACIAGVMKPLLGFNLRRDHRSLATHVASRGRCLECCFNLRRDHRSLATVKIGMASQGRYQFQSQARPPLPCHLTVHCPFDNDDYSFNLRRDHRSLATLSDLALTALLDVFQSQARPPLPCHRDTLQVGL